METHPLHGFSLQPSTCFLTVLRSVWGSWLLSWRPGLAMKPSPTGKLLSTKLSWRIIWLIISKNSASSYARVETLSGFANGIFLILISIFIVFEAIQRLIDPPDMNTNQLLVISCLGLAVNLVGMFATGHHHHGHSVSLYVPKKGDYPWKSDTVASFCAP